MISNSTIEIPVQDLKIGMYVSKLDRAWLGTAYPLQGTLMRLPNDVETLKNLCRFVFVDIERSEPFVVQRYMPYAIASVSSGTEDQNKNNQIQLKLDPLLQRVKTYDDLRTAEQEMPAATKAFDFVYTFLSDIAINIEQNARIDMRNMQEVVDTLCESVIRNPDAALLLAQLKSTGKDFTIAR